MKFSVRTISAVFCVFCYFQNGFIAQIPVSHNILEIKKNLLKVDFRSDDKLLVTIGFDQFSDCSIFIRDHQLKSVFPQKITGRYFVTARLNQKEVDQWKSKASYIDIRHKEPVTESFLSDYNPHMHGVLKAKQEDAVLFGGNNPIGLKENNIFVEDIDLIGRFQKTQWSANFSDGHATDMGTIIVGKGITYYTSKGILDEAAIFSTSFLNLFPDPDEFYADNQITVQNHSYGLEVEDYYGIEAVAYDQQVYDRNDIIHVFSAGNSGEENALFGRYKDVEGFSNLTGTFKHAKNILTVGAIDSSFNVLPISSRGPAHDGRLKPELVAYGFGGTSESAAAVSAASVVLQNGLREKGIVPTFDLVKSLLLMGCDDIGLRGPDFKSGYGLLNLETSLDILKEGNIANSVLNTTGDSFLIELTIPPGLNASSLKVGLAWIDPAADELAEQALINDLDLSVTHEGGDTFFPIIPNHTPDGSALNLSATPGRDSVNTFEMISIPHPFAGVYRIKVRLRKGQRQQFTLVSYLDTVGAKIIFPVGGQFVDHSTPLVVRWKNVENGPASLRFAIGDKMAEFEGLNPFVPGYRLDLPDTSAWVKLWLTAGETTDSVTFPTGRIPELRPIWRCGDTILYIINHFDQNEAVVFYEWNEEGWQELSRSSDSFQFFNFPLGDSAILSAGQYILDGVATHKSLAIRPGKINTDCISNRVFLNPVSEGLEVHLDLISDYFLEEISLFKLVDGEKIELKKYLPTALNYTYLDDNLIQGDNQYVYGFLLSDGSIKYSNVLTYFYVPEGDVLVFPNITRAAEGVNLAMNTFIATDLSLYNTKGQLVSKTPLLSAFDYLDTSDLIPGIYFYILTRSEGAVQSGKIIILP